MKKIIILFVVVSFSLNLSAQDSLLFFLPEVSWVDADSTFIHPNTKLSSLSFVILSLSDSAYYFCQSGFNTKEKDSIYSLAIEGVTIYAITESSNSNRKSMKLIYDEAAFKKPKKKFHINNIKIAQEAILLNGIKYFLCSDCTISFNRPTHILYTK